MKILQNSHCSNFI